MNSDAIRASLHPDEKVGALMRTFEYETAAGVGWTVRVLSLEMKLDLVDTGLRRTILKENERLF